MRYPTVMTVLLVATVACAGGEKKADTTAVAAAPAAAANDRARTAASVANAIEANPAKADSILEAAGYTRDSFQRAMYEIAADSAMSADYAAAKKQ
ncbi:MAG TPA: hypothetical protein VG432_00085 [Gemmatimonadaceae bacterium]|nr:hypothetical protein [Gemmatimonadaceae bacterium]